MALRNPSLFLYGYQITQFNSSLDFRGASLGPILQATLTLGYYSLTGLMEEVKRAMEAVDPAHIYSVTADRTIAGGTENRVTITTNGAYLDLLFLTGPRTASNCATILGFNVSDYTGSTTYTGSFTSGTRLVPNLVGYTFLPPEYVRKNFGSVNVSASGIKETLVWSIQKFWQADFRYIPEATATNEWVPLMTWMVQQRGLEFTPDITQPTIFYEGTLESTGADGKGLAYELSEMLPDYPFLYRTGLMKFRQRNT